MKNRAEVLAEYFSDGLEVGQFEAELLDTQGVGHRVTINVNPLSIAQEIDAEQADIYGCSVEPMIEAMMAGVPIEVDYRNSRIAVYPQMMNAGPLYLTPELIRQFEAELELSKFDDDLVECSWDEVEPIITCL
ncbi:hypothetical protein AB4571_15335 [Vibrio breoganii]|uniref:hypothetical protein n=1 Tax=Vibrio breoganii TaxID=553239 RepID=UPI000C81DAF5|nr:hypothetical protein [Vibrio breoganii]PML13832.1 hypothetical protein BCT84_12640 [Vibrio breoganii]